MFERSVGEVVLAVLGFGVIGVLIYAALHEPFRPVLRRIQVRVPPDWPRISILHLSDIHVQHRGDRLYRAQERMLESLPGVPDLVCVTGDVCERYGDAEKAAGLLGLVRPRVETVVILGNHEHNAPVPQHVLRATRRLFRWGEVLARRVLASRHRSSGTRESQQIAAVLAESGLRVLVNEGVRLEIDGRSLWVAGIDSVWASRARTALAFHGYQAEEPCLGLVHEPEGALSMVARGASLVLAGHTHGGQIKIPGVGALYTHRADPRIRIASGVQRLGRAVLHISAGFGHTTPLRLNCPPEVVWIDCVPAEHGAQVESADGVLVVAVRVERVDGDEDPSVGIR